MVAAQAGGARGVRVRRFAVLPLIAGVIFPGTAVAADGLAVVAAEQTGQPAALATQAVSAAGIAGPQSGAPGVVGQPVQAAEPVARAARAATRVAERVTPVTRGAGHTVQGTVAPVERAASDATAALEPAAHMARGTVEAVERTVKHTAATVGSNVSSIDGDGTSFGPGPRSVGDLGQTADPALGTFEPLLGPIALRPGGVLEAAIGGVPRAKDLDPRGAFMVDVDPSSTASASSATAGRRTAAGRDLPIRPVPDSPTAPASSASPGSGSFLFGGIAALFGAIAFVLVGQVRKLRLAPALLRPAPFISLLERPG